MPKSRFPRIPAECRDVLNLAVALLHSPKLLLLDEPTVGVDPQSRNHIYETLTKLNAAGMTILLSTHIMEEAHACAPV